MPAFPDFKPTPSWLVSVGALDLGVSSGGQWLPVFTKVVLDANNQPFAPESCSQALTYYQSPSPIAGQLKTISYSNGVNTWTQTFDWEADPSSGGFRLVSVSRWVKS